MINKARLVGRWCDIEWDTDGDLWVVALSRPYPGSQELEFGEGEDRISALRLLRDRIRESLGLAPVVYAGSNDGAGPAGAAAMTGAPAPSAP